MADVGNILHDDDFFGDTVDTPKEGIEQHRKLVCLRSVISKGKAYLRPATKLLTKRILNTSSMN